MTANQNQLPAGREALRELARIEANAYPWPFDADGRWRGLEE
ncbi:hypothetical protein ABZ622_39680 [Streptomyces sp. NPDC007164]